MIGGNRGKTVQAYKKSWPASLFLGPLHRTLNHVAKTRGAERDCFCSDPMPSWAYPNEYPPCRSMQSSRNRRLHRLNWLSLKPENGVPQSQSGVPQRT
jgi:hypothetical protein